MAQSGVTLADGLKNVYEELKQKKSISYIIFRLNKEYTQIEVCSQGKKGASFDDFKKEMIDASMEGQGRYAVYDLKDEEDTSKNALGKLVFICWLNDDCLKIKEKMLYASSKDAIKKACDGLHAELQINDTSDFTLDEIKEKVLKGKKV